jgi:hypothetical protein
VFHRRSIIFIRSGVGHTRTGRTDGKKDENKDFSHGALHNEKGTMSQA